MAFELHAQLKADCFALGIINNCTLLLHKNALLPWFILVPHTDETEIFKLKQSQQNQLHETTNQLARFVEKNFTTDKLNIATIGNIVSQLHIHVIGRHVNDFCWPAPAWGQTDSSEYSIENLNAIKQLLAADKILF